MGKIVDAKDIAQVAAEFFENYALSLADLVDSVNKEGQPKTDCETALGEIELNGINYQLQLRIVHNESLTWIKGEDVIRWSIYD